MTERYTDSYMLDGVEVIIDITAAETVFLDMVQTLTGVSSVPSSFKNDKVPDYFIGL